jgi:creatinine amidohydrolase
MLGRVAVAPEGDEAFGGLWPGPFGGNMDAADVREGTTVLLPVFHAGALFYFGDGHALQGDGEICGSGLETSMDVAFRFGLRKRKAIAWPRLEDAEHLMVAGSARPLTDALRIASAELVGWLVEEHGFAQAEAYQLLSQVALLRVANAVDPLYTVVAKFPKRYLPDRAAGTHPGVRLGDVPWTEAEALLTPERVVVLPLGAGVKEHGPHLPLRNDAILAEYYARRVLEARPVAMLPTLSYGYYPAFLDYPGSVSLSLETQRDAVAQICRSIARHGPRRFYVLNTGVSTRRPLEESAALLAREGILLGYTDILQAGKSAEDSVREQSFGTHADEIETSSILYMEPGAVHMDKAVKDGAAGRQGPLRRVPGDSPSGVYGDATLASWRKGERVVEQTVRDILAEIDALAQAPIPAGTPRSPVGPPAPR